MIIAILLLIAAYYIYKVLIQPYLLIRFYRKQGLHIEFTPLVGSFKQDYKNAEIHGDFYHTWVKHSRQEPRPIAAGKNMGSEVQLVFYDPDAIKTIFMDHETFIKHPTLFALSKELGENGLVLAEGKIWKKHRKLVSQCFHYQFLSSVTPEICKISAEFLENIKNNHKDLTNVSMMDECKKITGEVIGLIFFGEKLSSYEINDEPLTLMLARLIVEIGVVTFDPLYLLFGKEFFKLGLIKKHKKLVSEIKSFRKFATDLVKRNMDRLEKEYASGEFSKKTERKNIVDLFFEQRKNSPNECLSDDEIIDEYIAFFSDGMDTTGHFAAMSSYYLLKNPQYKEKMFEEVNQVFGSSDIVTHEEINKMNFMTNFQKETLRLAPPVATGMERVATKDVELSGVKVKKDTVLYACFPANYTDERYHARPMEFIPDRWVDPQYKTVETTKKYPGLFIPFAIGSRTCIGQHLAMNETKIIVSQFLKKFDYELSDPEYKLRFTQGFLREPLEDIRYKLTPK